MTETPDLADIDIPDVTFDVLFGFIVGDTYYPVRIAGPEIAEGKVYCVFGIRPDGIFRVETVDGPS